MSSCVQPADSSRIARWYGTVEEYERLLEACQRHCTCEYDEMDNLISQCPPHGVAADQRALDHLLFYWINRKVLLKEEHDDTPAN